MEKLILIGAIRQMMQHLNQENGKWSINGEPTDGMLFNTL